jgi:hypothetical protein
VHILRIITYWVCGDYRLVTSDNNRGSGVLCVVIEDTGMGMSEVGT